MTDEAQAGESQATTDSTQSAATTDASQAQATTGDATGVRQAHATNTQTAEQQAKTFTQAELDTIVKERLQRAQDAAKKQAEKAAADAEAKALAEQGKFKELYEKLQADAAEKDQRLKSMELDALRRGVAVRLGLPDGLHDRLRGETAEDIEADAKALLAALPKPTAPNINSAGGAQLTDAQVTAAQAQELAAIYGVSPKYFSLTGA